MVEIVRKVESKSAPAVSGGVPGSLQPVQDRELRIRVTASALERMQKQAVVSLESPVGSTWSIRCDEGSYLDGDDAAPPPLAYFSAAIAF
jgi:hypothetical protein